MVSSPSSLDALSEAIRSQNPFDRSLFVRQEDVWGKGFPDVPLLNAHVSDTIFEAISKVRSGQRQAIGITITSEKGLGKSHVISRIRHRLQNEGGALFFYMSEYGNLSSIKSGFLQQLTSSLRRIGSQDVTQWQELAAALVNQAKDNYCTPQQLVNGITLGLTKNPQLINELTDEVLEHKPEIDNPDLIKGILWTLSKPHSSYATKWLSGKELSQSKAQEMDLPNPSDEEKEIESFNTACQLLNLIGDYSTLVLCFDELDNADRDQQSGFTRAQVVASLVKDIYTSLKKGVLLMSMYPEVLQNQIKVMPQAEAVLDRTGEKVLELRYLNSDDVIALVSQWLKEFYENKGLTPPYSVYPFSEAELRELGKEKPIVRKVLRWCAENFKPTIDIPPKDPVETAFHDELLALDGAIEEYLEDKTALAKALCLNFLALEGETVESVKVKQVEAIQVTNVDQGYIDFKVIGEDNGEVVKIGIAVVQQAAGKGIGAALKRLIDYKKFGLTRGCLVRSKKINSSAKTAHDYLNRLLTKQGGEWALLRSEDIKPLLAISSVEYKREGYELSEEQIFNFIKKKNLAASNPLIREILSDPSGQIPDNVLDEDDLVGAS